MEKGTTPKARLRAIVDGRVQGVNFRYNTRRRAMELGLTGYVRNLSDGAVEAVAEGSQSKLEELLTFLRTGPRSAFVTQVNTEWLAASGEFDRFEVRY